MKTLLAGVAAIAVPALAVIASRALKDPQPEDESPMKSTNAIDLLKTQHEEVKAIFSKLENGRGDAASLVIELANNLAGHMAIEQDIFYPAIIAADPDMVSEGFEEHSIAELAIKRLLATDPSDDAFKARVVAAKELIEHHVKEEEGDLFKKARKILDRKQLEEFGTQMKARFDEVHDAGYQSVVPSSMNKTSADQARAGLHITDEEHEAPPKSGASNRKPSSRSRTTARKKAPAKKSRKRAA